MTAWLCIKAVNASSSRPLRGLLARGASREHGFGLPERGGRASEGRARVGVQPMEGVNVREAGQEHGQVIDKPPVGHAERVSGGLFRQTGEITSETVIGIVIPHV